MDKLPPTTPLSPFADLPHAPSRGPSTAPPFPIADPSPGPPAPPRERLTTPTFYFADPPPGHAPRTSGDFLALLNGEALACFASMNSEALACLCLTRVSYPGQMVSYADRLMLVDKVVRLVVALDTSGPSPHYQPPAQTPLWSVSHSLYTGRPHPRASTRPLAPPRHLPRPLGTTSVPCRRIEPSDSLR